MRSRAVRILLAAVGIGQAFTGGWALFSPRSWQTSFPTSSHPVVAPLGPYNEHLVRDVGALLLASAVLLFIAAMRLDRRLVLVAVGVNLIFQIPHLIFHLAHTAGMGGFENAFTLTGVIASPIALIAAAALSTRDKR